MKIAIYNSDAEDTRIITDAIDSLNSEFDKNFEVKVFDSANAMLKREWSFNVAILDVENEKDLKLAEALCEADSRLIIILVSSNLKYLDDAFEINAFRFFVKPLDEKRLSQALVNAYRKSESEEDYVYIKSGNTYTKVYNEEIIFVEINKRRTIITTVNTFIISDNNIVYWREKLPSNVFATPHNSFLVNLKYVTLYKKRQYVVLNNSYIIDISRTKSADFDAKYQQYLKTKRMLIS